MEKMKFNKKDYSKMIEEFDDVQTYIMHTSPYQKLNFFVAEYAKSLGCEDLTIIGAIAWIEEKYKCLPKIFTNRKENYNTYVPLVYIQKEQTTEPITSIHYVGYWDALHAYIKCILSNVQYYEKYLK